MYLFLAETFLVEGLAGGSKPNLESDTKLLPHLHFNIKSKPTELLYIRKKHTNKERTEVHQTMQPF